MRAAAVQLNSTDDHDRNLVVAERLVHDAADDGAELVVLPEKWTALGPPEVLRAGAQPLAGPALQVATGWAQELGIHLVAGSVAERVEGEEKLFNTSVLIDPEGRFAAVYRKIHMFDVDVEDVSYRESEAEQPGGWWCAPGRSRTSFSSGPPARWAGPRRTTAASAAR